MANSKDNLSAYGKTFIDFDEPSGNAMDSIGGWTGTLYNNPTRVTGWNGEGYAMSFNGTNQYIQFNNSIVPTSSFSMRFKIKAGAHAANGIVMTTQNVPSTNKGFRFTLASTGHLRLAFGDGTNYIIIDDDGGTNSFLESKKIDDNNWHDVLLTFDGFKLLLYIDNMILPIKKGTLSAPVTHERGLLLGQGNNASWFNGQLDSIEIYDRVISPIPDKYLVQHNSQYKYHDGTVWKTTTATEANFKQYGMSQLSQITEAQWKELTGAKSLAVWSDFPDKQWANAVLNTEPIIINNLLGDSSEVIYYTDSGTPSIMIETEVEPFSVYDYISELPVVIAYTESTEDIIVSTTTEPFEIYDEFGDTVDVLYYTDDETASSSDLIVDANWSPIDELEGDFEVVTWTEEVSDTAKRILDLRAIPQPQFIKLVNPKRVYGYLEDVLATDVSQTYRDEARYFVTGSDTSKWYVWDKETENFVVKDASTEQAISANGMKYKELNAITDKQWKTWISEYLNIGVFLKDNPRDTIISAVESVSYKDFLPRNTSTISNTSLYILNTTAKIDLQLNGNLLKGVLSDDDLTRVQYRVSLNGQYYYPSDGSWTKLGESPQNIVLSFSSSDVKIDDWNTVKVEFRDFYGTIDYWQNQFMGTYSGLMFKDVYGQYYSSEIGEVLNYLDFGVIIAGQTTIEHEVILKNQYGYDVKDIHLYANTSKFPTGMVLEFSDSLSPFSPQPELRLKRTLTNNEEMSFFIRLKTELGATPDANGSFDIIVRAEKA